MGSTAPENISEMLSELNYKQQQALFFGGEQPAYTFRLPDSKTAHECGQGLAGLYRAIRWLQRDDIPQADEMHAMLDMHQSNPDYILAYVRKQVEDTLPAGSAIRANLLAIVHSDDIPAKKVDRFMAYMDMLMPVVGKNSMTMSYEYAMLGMRQHADAFVAAPDRPKIKVFLREIEMMSDMGIQYYTTLTQWVELVNKCAPLGGMLLRYSMASTIAAVLAENRAFEIPFDQLQQWYDESVAFKKYENAKRLLASMIQRFPDRFSVNEIREMCNTVFNFNHSLDQMFDIQIAVIKSGVPSNEINSWLDQYVSDTGGTQGESARWDLYQKLALAIVNRREVDEHGVVTKQAMPDVPESMEARMIYGWITKLDLAGEHAMAAELCLAAYNKGVADTSVDGVMAFIDAAFEGRAGGFVQIGYGGGTEIKGELKPDPAIEVAAALVETHGDKLSADDIFAWNDTTTSIVASVTNGERILVAALRNASLRSKINVTRLSSVVQGCIDLAVGRKTPAFYVKAARIAAAAVENGVMDEDEAEIVMAELQKYGAIAWAEPLLTAMVMRRQEFGIAPSRIQAWLDTLVKWDRLPDAQRFAQVVLAQGVALDRTMILGLAEKLGATDPVKAVELCIAAQDAGIDVPEEIVQRWHDASYEGKSPEEAANNAMALIEVYRSRPLVQRMTPTERDALEQEIREAFDKLLQCKDEMGITISTPCREAMERIHDALTAK